LPLFLKLIHLLIEVFSNLAQLHNLSVHLSQLRLELPILDL
jgi:hypothetical protein